MRPAGSILACALWWNCHVSVLTYHNDLARTGQNPNETVLTPASVSSGRFGRLFSDTVDGAVYAQPLYLPGVVVPKKGIHNMVFVATEHDSVYAFDADNDLGAPLWQVSFLDPGGGVTTASATDLECGSITPEVGITATPVIDPASGTLYVVAMTEQASTGLYEHWLHALDVATGAERPGSPVEIQASTPGQGDGNTTVQFKPWLSKERAGLLLLNGVVYTSWSSQCDTGNYHGWIIGYNASTLEQTSVYVDTPDWNAGAFWQGGAAPAADANGNLYAVSANGTFDANRGGRDLAESILKLATANGLSLADYFTPYNADDLSNKDLDLGSSGALLLPDSDGSHLHPHLLVIGSKPGTIYLLDRDQLGHFHTGADTQIVQSLDNAAGPLFGMPAYFNHRVYFSAAHDQVKAFSVHNGRLSELPVSMSDDTFALLGTVPSISSHGLATGILWTIDPAGALHAYDAADLSRELYQGRAGSFVKFSTPTIANGKVYVGTANSVAILGLLPTHPASITAAVSSESFHGGPFAPGSIISLFGTNLAAHAVSAGNRPWPPVLGAVSVFVDGGAAPIGYVSPSQINLQLPPLARAGPATITVVTGGQIPPPLQIDIQTPTAK